MHGTVTLSKEAVKQLSELQLKLQGTVRKDLLEMTLDPFHGLVKALQGKKSKGIYRKVSGRYRIIFVPRHADRTVEIRMILLRNEGTYR